MIQETQIFISEKCNASHNITVIKITELQ